MRSHPYTAAQRGTWYPHRSNDHTIWWDQRPQGHSDPSFEPWSDNPPQPAIVRARITHFLSLPLTRDQLAEWERPVTRTAVSREDDPEWTVRWTNGSISIFRSDVFGLRTQLECAEAKRWKVESIERDGVPVHVMSSEDGIIVAARRADGVVVVSECEPGWKVRV